MISLNGCTFVKLLKAKGKVIFFFFKKKNNPPSFEQDVPPPRFSFQIRIQGVWQEISDSLAVRAAV